MSKTALNNLRDYLISTLSPGNMIWLATQLSEYANKHEMPHLHRHTMEEINAMLDDAETNIAAGIGIPDEESWDELDKEMALAEKGHQKMANAL